MFSNIIAGSVFGLSAYLIQIETDVSKGMPCFEMVGDLGAEVREARERVRVALKNNGITIPPMHITINLSPADMKKEGAGYDLSIAVGVMTSLGILSKEVVEGKLFLGELGLDGEIKALRGVLPIVRLAASNGIHTCVLPLENQKEGNCIDDVTCIGVKNLKEVIAYLKATPKEKEIKSWKTADVNTTFGQKKQMLAHMEVSQERELEELDFADVNGQNGVKRAAEITAAGFHHLLMIGPPGSGKTMIARRLPHILPPLEREEALEISAIYSIAGRLDTNTGLLKARPFISPHHTITEAAMAGAGSIPKPGAVTMAHKGVLFLDELTEFKKPVLEILRQPLEERKIHIMRSRGAFAYPADFILVAATNPCPCGYFPDFNKCNCSAQEVKRYMQKISGPILDRLDICIEAPKVEIASLLQHNANESSAQIRERVLVARKMQEKRFAESNIRFNAQMSAKDIQIHAPLSLQTEKMLEQICQKMDISARAYHKIIKTARTIADLEEKEHITEIHLCEAVQYRMTGKNYWEQRKQ